MANKPITVHMLKTMCEKEIAKGNGRKHIMISDDDERKRISLLVVLIYKCKRNRGRRKQVRT